MRGSRTHKLLAALLSLIFIGSLSWLTDWLWDSRQSGRAHEQAVRIAMEEPADEEPPALPSPVVIEVPDDAAPLAGTPAPEPIPEEAAHLAELDLEGLRQVSEDVLGWIHIPGSDISYPLMDSEDNRDYLELTWNGEKSRGGSIFLECRSSEDLGDFHTLIYGHNMKDGTMFGQLSRYREQSHLEAYPHVYIATEQSVLRYEIFSAYIADVVSDTYRLYFEDEERRQSAIDFYLASSWLDSGLVPDTDSRLLTLSTCHGVGNADTRWVVQAALTGVFPR